MKLYSKCHTNENLKSFIIMALITRHQLCVCWGRVGVDLVSSLRINWLYSTVGNIHKKSESLHNESKKKQILRGHSWGSDWQRHHGMTHQGTISSQTVSISRWPAIFFLEKGWRKEFCTISYCAEQEFAWKPCLTDSPLSPLWFVLLWNRSI